MFDINKFMRRVDLNQEQLAQKLNLKRTKVATWTAGYRVPGYEDLVALFKLGMTLNEAFGPEVEEIILRSQPSLDVSNLSKDDCLKIVSVAFGALQDKPLNQK